MEQAPQSRLKDLITKGKEQGYLTFAQVNDHLPQDIIDSDQVEDIVSMINDMGIQVFENAPDADTLMMSEANTDEDAAEAAAQALATVESEIGRTTDPVRMYMREMVFPLYTSDAADEEENAEQRDARNDNNKEKI